MTADTHTFEDNYAETVDRIRIFDEGDGWAIDGFNKSAYTYTELVWKYDTPAAAREAVPSYVEELRAVGITVSDEYSVEVGAPMSAEDLLPYVSNE